MPSTGCQTCCAPSGPRTPRSGSGSSSALAELHRLLETGELDFCFVPAALASPDIRWHHLQTVPIALLVPAAHRLADRAGVALRDLAGEELLLGKPEDVLREIMDGYFRQVGLAPRVACEADESAAIEDYVVAGLGVALIPALDKPTPSRGRSRSSSRTARWPSASPGTRPATCRRPPAPSAAM